MTASGASTTSTAAAALRLESLHTLRRFLSHVDPASLSHLPTSADAPLEEEEESIAAWPVLHTAGAALVIRRHAARPLFSVQAFLPRVEARQFWTLMSSVENRNLWDASIELAEVQRRLGEEDEEEEGWAKGTYMRVEEMRFGSM